MLRGYSTQESLRIISVVFFLSLFLSSSTTIFAVNSEQNNTGRGSVHDAGKLDLFDGRNDTKSGMPGKYMEEQIARTMAPSRQVCNSAETRNDFQHNSTIGRQLVYGGFYNAAFDYVFMIYTWTWQAGATMITQVNYAVFDWTAGTHDWDFDCCDVKVGTDNSRYCNMDAVPATTGSSLPAIAYHHSDNNDSPRYTIADLTNVACTDQFTKDTLPPPPCAPDVQTGFCGDIDADQTPYIWPKIDVQIGPNDSIITHIASAEDHCESAPPEAIEISSLVYYRKASNPGDPISGTWSNAYFMDSAYSICQHVVSEKFGPNVYYVYPKPMYYYNGMTHPCEANGLGHYQQTNDVVFRQSNDYGRNWGTPVNITEYGVNGFEDGNTEPANSDLACMVDPNNVLHIVWGSSNRDPENNCTMYYAMKMWHWDSDNDCISLAYDASHPRFFSGYLTKWDHVVTQQNISWCDDKLYISFVRFGAHPIEDTSKELGQGPAGADSLYQVADIMVVASDINGQMGRTWTTSVNLTDTDGTDCIPGICEHEVYPFMAPHMTDSLMIEYIDDKDAGAWMVGEGSRTDNPVMFMTWPCFSMADVGPNCAYTTSPDPPEWEEVALAPNGSTAGCTTPASYTDSVILSNGGNVDIVYSTSSSDPTWLTVTGGAVGTASAGAGPKGLPNGCAAPAIIKWTASSAVLAAGNYRDSITVDIVNANCGDFDIVVNVVVACEYFLPEWARLTSGMWTVDVWNVPLAGHQANLDETPAGNMQFYVGDTSIHPLFNEALIVGWIDGTPKMYGDMMGENLPEDYSMRALDSIQVSTYGNPAGGNGYYKTYGEWCTPDSVVKGIIEHFVPGHQDTAVLIEKVTLWTEGGALAGFIAGEGIDWDVRDDSNYDQPGVDMAREMVYQHGCRAKDSVVAGLSPYYVSPGSTSPRAAVVVDNHDYVYDYRGYDPDSLYGVMDTIDNNIPYYVFQDSCTDLNSIYKFYEGTLTPGDTLEFIKIKAVADDGIIELQQMIDKGKEFIVRNPGIYYAEFSEPSGNISLNHSIELKGGALASFVLEDVVGGMAIPWTGEEIDPDYWLTVSVDSGITPTTITFGYDVTAAEALGVGTYLAYFTVTAPCATNSPLDICIELEVTEGGCTGLCGDANSDGSVNISDAVWIISYVFASGAAPIPLACGDANSDGTVNVSDMIWIYNFIFVGASAPGDCSPGSWIDGDCCPFIDTGVPGNNYDPGDIDVIEVSDIYIQSSSDPMTFNVPINLVNDEDIYGASLGFHYSSGDITIDSISRSNGVLEGFPGDFQIHPAENMAIVGFSFGPPDYYYVSPGDSLLINLWFTLSANAGDQTITVDSSFFPPAGYFLLTKADGTSLIPHVIPGHIYVSGTTPDSITTDPVFLVSPSGDVPFRVYLQDGGGEKITGNSSVFIVMEDCESIVHCPGSIYGDTLYPIGPSDENGVLSFYMDGGGCDNNCVAHVKTATEEITTVPVKMFDITGDLGVSILSDLDSSLCNDYNDNGGYDADDLSIFAEYVGDYCGQTPCERFSSDFRTIPDYNLGEGTPIILELALSNNNFDPCYIDYVDFYQSGFGVGLEMQLVGTVTYLDTLYPGEEDTITINAIVPGEDLGTMACVFNTDCCPDSIMHAKYFKARAKKLCNSDSSMCYDFIVYLNPSPDTITSIITAETLPSDDWTLDTIYMPSTPISGEAFIMYQICTPDTIDHGTKAEVVVLLVYGESGFNTRAVKIVVYSGGSTGDANHDCIVNISDAVRIINYIFVGGLAPYPCIAGDCNCDGSVNISDAVVIINYVFISGAPPCKAGDGPVPSCL